jgi:hypothetical protein
MVRANLQRTILVYLSWLAFISVGLVTVLADVLPFVPSYVRPENLFFFLVHSELFFVLVLWPLFIPKILSEEPDAKANILLLQVVVLFVFVLPLAFLCQSISNLDLWTFFKGQLQVAVLASFVAALFSFAHAKRWAISPAYYLGFFVLSAGLPFVSYLLFDFHGSAAGFLAWVSPFWAASRLDTSVIVQCCVFGAATIGLLLGPAFLRKAQSTAA